MAVPFRAAGVAVERDWPLRPSPLPQHGLARSDDHRPGCLRHVDRSAMIEAANDLGPANRASAKTAAASNSFVLGGAATRLITATWRWASSAAQHTARFEQFWHDADRKQHAVADPAALVPGEELELCQHRRNRHDAPMAGAL
jgi:hypothetical protein